MKSNHRWLGKLSLTWVMLFLSIIVFIYILSLVILAISSKIYFLLYTNYTLGLFFPNAKFKSVIIFVVILMILLMIVMLSVIKKLRNK